MVNNMVNNNDEKLDVKPGKNPSKKKEKEAGITISNVDNDSIAAEVGLEAGDILLNINGKKPLDIVEYRLLAAEEDIELEVLKDEQLPWVVEIEKDFQEPLGLGFDPVTIDEVRTCNNDCIFCFVQQNPPGMRASIQFRDDDYRLSFLEGNYTTLNNLTGKDLRRIIKDRLSPLYVSLHCTRPRLRRKMMQNHAAGQVMKKLRALTRKGIHLHGQVVVCPGWNDGAELERTLKDLASLGAAMESVSIVPVGLTGCREKLTPLRSVTEEEAVRTVEMVHDFQEKMLNNRGTRMAFLADEYYLKAGMQVPTEEAYESYPQLSNGVGLIRLFWEEYKEWVSNVGDGYHQPHVHTLDQLENPLQVAVATAEAAREVIAPVVEELNKANNLQAKLITVPNSFFGSTVTVAGLLTGYDLLETLKGEDLGKAVLIPAVMLKEGEEVFLDGRTLSEVTAELNTEIIPVFDLQEMVENINLLASKGGMQPCHHR